MTQMTTKTTRYRRTKAVPDIGHYEAMYAIRTVEKLLLEYCSKGLLRGTTHTYLGQEAIAVCAASFLSDDDIIVSNHRSHGHYLSYCEDCHGLLDEIKGSVRGICHGLGGSQHLHYKNFYSNGVLGGTVPVATGMALAEKLKGTGSIAVCFLGDGALGEGVVYESFNMASLWNTPVLYVIENNRYAQSTPVELNLAGSIPARVKAFGIETREIESNDIGELLPCFEMAFDYVRQQGKPICQVVHTYRLGPHSKGDDTRCEDEVKFWRARDPLELAKKYFSPSIIAELQQEQEERIRKTFEAVFGGDEPGQPMCLERDEDLIPARLTEETAAFVTEESAGLMVDHLNGVLHTVMQQNTQIYVLGEDLLDPYGGAFKVVKGLSTRFPGRVFSSPVSEAGLVGIANGMALRGLVPIVEIMFGDFVTLVMDQVVNYGTKFRRMYGNQVNCPLIIRVPMGGYRGYGPTHSQSLEKLFFGVPGLIVVACDPVHNQQLIWERMVALQSPCLYVENKSLYGQKLKPSLHDKIDHFYADVSQHYFPTVSLQITSVDQRADSVLLTYGGMTPMAMAVARKLYIEEEIVVKVVIPSQISPLPEDDLLEAIGSCRTVVVLEEGTERNGWGAEIAALLNERVEEKVTVLRCSARNTIIPNSREGEIAVLPKEEACYDLLKRAAHAV